MAPLLCRKSYIIWGKLYYPPEVKRNHWKDTFFKRKVILHSHHFSAKMLVFGRAIHQPAFPLKGISSTKSYLFGGWGIFRPPRKVCKTLFMSHPLSGKLWNMLDLHPWMMARNHRDDSTRKGLSCKESEKESKYSPCILKLRGSTKIFPFIEKPKWGSWFLKPKKKFMAKCSGWWYISGTWIF